ncbi:putative helicase [Neisseria perflava]|uniref:type ISP restriction/modification enzyme n=1 Tax=Neisseria perflava TaxID=33053 RepID=UPI00209D3913|nr:type ISP restriction/modification enzyme [Neisseria perflava]MCP1772525.1 putative helicase [Neisseria perflava]
MFEFEIGEIERALTAKIVKKVGNRMYWDEWADDVAKIAQTHISQMQAVLDNPDNGEEIRAFEEFFGHLKQDLNDSLSKSEVVEMLAQHIITKPIFDALFKNDNFTRHNPMSQAIEKVMAVLYRRQMDKENERLNEFYDNVRLRVEGIRSAQGKQEVIKELYDKFFNKAFPKLAEKMGIVYTPVEVVDFIIRSVEDVLQQEFGSSLNAKGVQIIDPFTGTGTFITRLLQSGLIAPENLPAKYGEIHANEMLLLAYYIASINIETTYHALANPQTYTPFDGICLTDTFAMYEPKDLADHPDENSRRRKRQKALDIKVIIGNPPYSAGQESANDNNANTAYPGLDRKIEQTYAAYSSATNKNSLYDSYIRAIRWASDRIGNQGVIGFITNANFIEKVAMNGVRKCLADEFSSLYFFHLRGGIRGKSGDSAKKEGQSVFNIMTPTAIFLLVKNPNAEKTGQIYFHDIGSYLKRTDKLEMIAEYQSINGITDWQTITPDSFNDWLNQRDVNFNQYPILGHKPKKGEMKEFVIFENYSRGAETGRDAWVYNFSDGRLSENMQKMIEFYNSEVQRYQETGSNQKVEDFINTDTTKISWSSSLIPKVKNGILTSFNQANIRMGVYRPFSKLNVYFDEMIVHRVGQIPQIFPTPESENLVICVTGAGARKEFSTLMSNTIPDLELLEKNQCFPLYLYEKTEAQDNDLFQTASAGYQRQDAINDKALLHFQDFYGSQTIGKEDIFYYIYGLLHSETYREKYADNLSKQLPRIPRVKSEADFWAFGKAGRNLAQLHLHYETAPIYTRVNIKGLSLAENQIVSDRPDSDFYVEKIKFAKKDDKTHVVYNANFTIENIPEQAFDYIVNSKSALEWVMERQCVKTDKDSGIANNANDWALETMGNARYPLELFLRVITVSLETMKIVNALPELVLE